MKVIKILSVFGTRPEAIKFAPVIKLLEKDRRFVSVVCVTGQHREMLDQILNLFEIKADYDLNVMTENQMLAGIASKILQSITPILSNEKPDMVLIQGDTTSAFSAALASYYLKIPIGHIEAGLRTGNIFYPFPEEGNRTLITRLSSLHFAPTKLSYQNLIKENVSPKNIVITGNTGIDALFFIIKKAQARGTEYWQRIFGAVYPVLLSKKRIILVTSHRRENFGQGLLNIARAVKEIALANSDIEIIYPLHLNPNVQAPVRSRLSNLANVHLIDPLDYESFIYLMSRAYIILTDSGGIQEEAPSLGKPVLVMREKTERPEVIEAGTGLLVGTQKEKIVKETSRLLKDDRHYSKMSKAHNLYGKGRAGQRIIRALVDFSKKFND